ncbi:spore cortex protein [Neisseria sp. ZJ106]|uniref:Spore cortex protein n=1 Tax=Neisseria lisongii TaxID=2912188 RepID=A0AAW5AHH5_9NEIS|nr:spore cortex protein [Neisseria lisongii]MCF7520872.1 spore cortex protein [Neisseria lisongii]MCF7530535.1 spore cortex protein [Neisseria lisongii]WCL71320.1 spore cortex protein [Neisseria lisongii]
MRYTIMLLAALAVAGCSWETYRDADGHTGLRQKYETGTPVYYQDGSYSRNMKYNQFRPEQHAVKPAAGEADNVRGTTWKQPEHQAR